MTGTHTLTVERPAGGDAIEPGAGNDFDPATVAALYRDEALQRPIDDLSRIGATPEGANLTEG
jgi:hypothetical protein